MPSKLIFIHSFFTPAPASVLPQILDNCALNCIGTVGPGRCTTGLNCLCRSDDFLASTEDCFNQICKNLQSAQGTLDELCALAGVNISSSSSPLQSSTTLPSSTRSNAPLTSKSPSATSILPIDTTPSSSKSRPTSASSNSISGTSSSPSSISIASSFTGLVSAIPAAETANPSRISPSHNLQTVAIAGIVVGAVLAIIIASLLLYFCRRRRRQKKLESPMKVLMSQSTNVERSRSLNRQSVFVTNRSASRQTLEEGHISGPGTPIGTVFVSNTPSSLLESNASPPSASYDGGTELDKMLEDLRNYKKMALSRINTGQRLPTGIRCDASLFTGSSSLSTQMPVPNRLTVDVQNEVPVLGVHMNRLTRQLPQSLDSEAPPLYRPEIAHEKEPCTRV